MFELLTLLAGACQSAMASLNGMLQNYAGMFGMSFAVHFTGGALLILYMKTVHREKLRISGLPWYLYSAGFFGIAVVIVSSLCINRLGVSAVTCLSVTGQLIASAVIDQFGWFGVPKVPFDKRRLPCFALILLGLVIINLPQGGIASDRLFVLFLLLAVLNGCATVVSKMINYRCTQVLGTWNGSLVNYVVASVVSVLLILATSSFRPDLTKFNAPWYLYTGGAFGIVAFVLSMITLNHMQVMRSTILLLAGNLAAGILFDALVFQNISPRRIIGILIVAAGIVWDSRTSQRAAERA